MDVEDQGMETDDSQKNHREPFSMAFSVGHQLFGSMDSSLVLFNLLSIDNIINNDRTLLPNTDNNHISPLHSCDQYFI